MKKTDLGFGISLNESDDGKVVVLDNDYNAPGIILKNMTPLGRKAN